MIQIHDSMKLWLRNQDNLLNHLVKNKMLFLTFPIGQLINTFDIFEIIATTEIYLKLKFSPNIVGLAMKE